MGLIESYTERLMQVHPTLLALGGTLFSYGMTALGASLVFFFKKIEQRILNALLGFAAGVMIAASFWSLLAPAIEISRDAGKSAWAPATIGFLCGGGFLLLVDKLLPHIHFRLPDHKAEGLSTSWKRSVLLILAITLHNIPEGLAVGVAFGALVDNPDPGLLTGAIALAIGIGLQNFPEGAAVSIPLRREGLSRRKAFHYGQLSGMVEPIAGVAGALLVVFMTPILPYALAFAAGAMIFVVIEEIIPEAQTGHESDYSTIGALIGFSLMMVLDVALG